MLIVGGCASRSVFTDQDALNHRYEILSQRQQSELTSYAALLRVKLAHEGKINDFRLELFSEGDQKLSIFVRGFLGSSAFKAVLREDSLKVYFPEERKYFVGLRGDLVTGELSDTRHIIDYLLSLFSGYAPDLDPTLWNSEMKGGSARIIQRLADKVHGCQLEAIFRVDDAVFPYLALKQIDLVTADDKLRGTLTVQSSHYNRAIPPAKLQLIIPANAVLISADELTDILTQ